MNPHRQQKVLIADSRGIWDKIRDKLERTGIQVQQVVHGRDIIRVMKKGTVDLLIVNSHLSDISGVSMIGMAREIHPSLPVILTTQQHTPILERESRALGLVYYQAAPTRPELYFEIMLRALHTPGYRMAV